MDPLMNLAGLLWINLTIHYICPLTLLFVFLSFYFQCESNAISSDQHDHYVKVMCNCQD